MNKREKLGDAGKVVPIDTFIVVNAYFRKKERSQINNITLHFKILGKGHLNKPKGRRKDRVN